MARAGDRLATLEALRDVLAQSIVEVDPDKRAPLAKQLSDVLKQIAELGSGKDDDPLDQLLRDLAANDPAPGGVAPEWEDEAR